MEVEVEGEGSITEFAERWLSRLGRRIFSWSCRDHLITNVVYISRIKKYRGCHLSSDAFLHLRAHPNLQLRLHLSHRHLNQHLLPSPSTPRHTHPPSARTPPSVPPHPPLPLSSPQPASHLSTTFLAVVSPSPVLFSCSHRMYIRRMGS